MRTLRWGLLSLGVSIVLLVAARAGAAPATAPAPGLSPVDVVRAQLAALRDPDSRAGVTRAYGFAALDDQQMIGTVEDFAAMLAHNYADMLTQTRADVTLQKRRGDIAQVLAELSQPDGQTTDYVFLLIRQHGGDCDGCWRTDGVIAVEPADDAPTYSI